MVIMNTGKRVGGIIYKVRLSVLMECLSIGLMVGNTQTKWCTVVTLLDSNHPEINNGLSAKGSTYCIWAIDTLPAESVINLPTAARKKLLCFASPILLILRNGATKYQILISIIQQAPSYPFKDLSPP
jgi:hypothetical protein